MVFVERFTDDQYDIQRVTLHGFCTLKALFGRIDHIIDVLSCHIDGHHRVTEIWNGHHLIKEVTAFPTFCIIGGLALAEIPVSFNNAYAADGSKKQHCWQAPHASRLWGDSTDALAIDLANNRQNKQESDNDKALEHRRSHQIGLEETCNLFAVGLKQQ